MHSEKCNDNELNIESLDKKVWTLMVDAVCDDVDKFSETVDRVLKSETKEIHKMAKRETHYLRILDNVCYNSLCGMIVYESIRIQIRPNVSLKSSESMYQRLMVLRARA